MKRITRNERIKDITPERRLKAIPRGDADHDPMFPPPGFTPHWLNGYEFLLPPDHPLLARPAPATPEPPLELLPEPPEQSGSETQHNHHVTMYWNWRIDRMEARLHG